MTKKERQKYLYDLNPEKYRERQKRYRISHPERYRDYEKKTKKKSFCSKTFIISCPC